MRAQINSSGFKKSQIQILNSANSKYAGRYLFGGSNITEIPFTVVGGRLCYNRWMWTPAHLSRIMYMLIWNGHGGRKLNRSERQHGV